jgi:CRP-like cAMP-binding protein
MHPGTGPANHILSRLPAAELERLWPDLEPVELSLRMVLQIAHKNVDDIYFPESGIVSAVAGAGRDRFTEIGVVGFDGFTGHCVIVGDGRSAVTMQMQTAGRGLRISAVALKGHFERSAPLRQLLNHSIAAFGAQTVSTALANGRAHLDERIARWLLMFHDRVDGNRLEVTHEGISLALGVRRPGVTCALQILASQNIIGTERATIVILDRQRLAARAVNTYGIAESEHLRLTGWLPKLDVANGRA